MEQRTVIVSNDENQAVNTPDIKIELGRMGWTSSSKPDKRWLNERLLPNVVNGDTKAVRALLDLGADIHTKNTSYASPLIAAAWRGNLDIVRLLLDRGAKTEAKEIHGRTALMLSSWYGHTGCARALLDHGAEIEAHDHVRQTPVMWASMERYTDSLWLLLERGADIHATDDNGFRAIHHAIVREKAAVLRILIDRGESTEGTMPDGTSYDEALESKPELLAVLRSKRSARAIERVIRSSSLGSPSTPPSP
jgi:ankyrin repeat protein